MQTPLLVKLNGSFFLTVEERRISRIFVTGGANLFSNFLLPCSSRVFSQRRSSRVHSCGEGGGEKYCKFWRKCLRAKFVPVLVSTVKKSVLKRVFGWAPESLSSRNIVSELWKSRRKIVYPPMGSFVSNIFSVQEHLLDNLYTNNVARLGMALRVSRHFERISMVNFLLTKSAIYIIYFWKRSKKNIFIHIMWCNSSLNFKMHRVARFSCQVAFVKGPRLYLYNQYLLL